MLLQSLSWHCVECATHHERDVCEEQHPYIHGMNKQQESDHGMSSLLLFAATV